MYDQLTPSALGCYGHPVARTPHIDRLAAAGVVFDAAYTNSPLCTPARYCLMTGQLPSATRGYDNAAYLASTIPTFAHYVRDGGLSHGALGQDALRRARPAARLRGAPHDGHLSGGFRLDAGLARARRAHRLVVPQHGQRHRRRRGRGDQPAAVRRRDGVPRDARAARPGAQRRRAPVPAGRELHPPARSLRHAPGILGPLRGARHPAARHGCRRRADGPALGAIARRVGDVARDDHAGARARARAARTSATCPTSTTGPAGCWARWRRSASPTTRSSSCSPTTATCWASAGSGTR